MLIFFPLFLISFLLTVIFIYLVRRISLNFNFYDNPDNDSLKVHKSPIPFLGGLAVLLAFLLTLISAWLFKKNGFFDFQTSQLIAIFIGSFIAWFYGFWDDTRWQQRLKMGQWAKIFFQIPITLTLALILFNAQIQWLFMPLAIIGILITAFYLLFIINAANIQDGLDGLLAGLVLISSIGFFILSFLTNNILGLILSSIMIGNVFAFLFFNWHPASIFMGNNGSYFLGFLMVVLVIMNTRPGNFIWFFGPLLILGMPLFNAGYVFLRRTINRQPLLSADRHHFYDLLHRKTGSVQNAVLINYLIQIVFVALGLIFLIKLG
jgi:UDP-GlcNAc:undecaprenyl-phosphate GlcNAc-1-phosphate transferase